MHIYSELTGTISHCSSFSIDVFLANQSPGTGHKPKSHLFKTDYSLLGHCLLYCNCLRPGLAGANLLHLFWKRRQDFSLHTVQLWQAKADKMPPLWGNSAADNKKWPQVQSGSCSLKKLTGGGSRD